jgi:hypothetical protein
MSIDVSKEAESWVFRILLQAKRLLHAIEVNSQEVLISMPPAKLIQVADALAKADAIARRALRLDEPSGPANLHLVVVDTGQIANARAEAIEAKPVTLAIGQGDQAVPGPQP